MISFINEKDFSKVVEKSNKPVFVEFFADWCGQSGLVHEQLEQLVAENQNVMAVRVNVDENNNLAERFGVSFIPCVKVFEYGENTKTIMGFRTKSQFEAALEK